jgi:uncharacterized protein
MEVSRELLRDLFARHSEIAATYLFGSHARGEARPWSDLDLAVLFRRSVPRSVRDRLAAELIAEISRATGIEEIDLVDLEEQGPIFAHAVLCEGARLHEADHARRVDFESETVTRALDFRPTYEIATRGKATALRGWLRRRRDARSHPSQA